MALLYAIVGNIERARFMLESGVPYLQLRFKDRPLAPLRAEIRAWKSRYPATRVIVNDSLEEALAVEAWGLHLGQEDADRYAPKRLQALSEGGGPVLGISTHDNFEFARAKSLGAAMVGFGPVFDTSTKVLTRKPQGVDRLASAVKEFDLPVIAIGGIGEDTLDAVADTGVAMIAMIAYLDRLSTYEDVQVLAKRIRR